MLPRSILASASLLFCMAPGVARADEPRELKNTGAGFLALETLGTLVVFAGYSIATGDAPKTCSWCESNGFDEGARGIFRMSNPRPPAAVSHVLSIGVAPLGGFAGLLVPALQADRGSYAWKDGWIMINAFLLTTGLTDGTKKLFGRQRPAFHHGKEGETEASGEKGKREGNLSFFSGDTAWAFTFASSAATLAYLHGYKTAPYLAVGGGVVATAAGVLRMSADMHWATDVMTGAFVGSAVGIGLPLLLHRRVPAEIPPASQVSSGVQVTSVTGGVTGVSLGGTF